MKISRKNLKRLILENILEEQDAGTGARKMRGDGSKEEQIADRKEMVSIVRGIIDDLNLEGTVILQVVLGRRSLRVNRIDVSGDLKKGDVRKRIVKAIKDEINKTGSRLAELRDQLKGGRALKIGYEKEAGGASSTEDQGIETKQDTGGGEAGDGGAPSGGDDIKRGDITRDDSTGYTDRYTLRKDGSIQYTSPKSGKTITVTPDSNEKAYNAIMKAIFPDIPKVPPKKAKPAAQKSRQPTLGELVNNLASGGDIGVTQSARTSPQLSDDSINVAFVVSDVENTANYLFDADLPGGVGGAGYLFVRKEKAGQPDANTNKTIAGALFQLTPEGVMGVILDRNAKVVSKISETGITSDEYEKPAVDADGNLTTTVSAKAFQAVDVSILNRIMGRMKEVASQPMSESSYGKSRGTLMRERYWGRY